MLSAKPNYFVDKVSMQKQSDPLPYDAIIYEKEGIGVIGFVQDNFICDVVNEKGEEPTIRIPTAIAYFKENNLNNWQKKLFGYKEGIDEALYSEGMNKYVVYDHFSELSFLAMPLNGNTKVTRSRNNLELFLKEGHEDNTESLTRFISEFKDIDFGLFGSRSILDSPATRISDIDLVIYGSKNLQRIVSIIEENDDLCQKIKLTTTPSSTIDRYIPYYMKKFNLTKSEARIITIRKRRYILEPNIKLSLNCALSVDELERKIPIVIGSHKIHEIAVDALALDTSLSSALPRIFEVEIEGKKIDVVTNTWSIKDFIRQGDRVKIVGALRESEDLTFISLEKPGDIIKPIANGG